MPAACKTCRRDMLDWSEPGEDPSRPGECQSIRLSQQADGTYLCQFCEPDPTTHADAPHPDQPGPEEPLPAEPAAPPASDAAGLPPLGGPLGAPAQRSDERLAAPPLGIDGLRVPAGPGTGAPGPGAEGRRPPRPGARVSPHGGPRDGKATRDLAYRRLKGLGRKQREALQTLNAVTLAGLRTKSGAVVRDLTDMELAKLLKWERTSVCGRRNELKDRGLVEASQQRACCVTGNTCTAWRTVQAFADDIQQVLSQAA